LRKIQEIIELSRKTYASVYKEKKKVAHSSNGKMNDVTQKSSVKVSSKKTNGKLKSKQILPKKVAAESDITLDTP